MSDWIVRTYDKDDNEVACFIIKDKTENEAQRDAENSPEVQASIQDEDCDMGGWTMTRREDE